MSQLNRWLYRQVQCLQAELSELPDHLLILEKLTYGLIQFLTTEVLPLQVPHWPAFTIEAQRNTPVNVKYENNLIDIATGDFLTYANVNLIADQTLHWADPLKEGFMGDPPNMMNMTEYTGPVPVVPHLHGGEVASESDGGPDAWFTPGYELTGPSWGIDGTDQDYDYPNTQEAATLMVARPCTWCNTAECVCRTCRILLSER